MIISLRERLVRILRWSEQYTKTDMVYFASGNFWILAGRAITAVTSIGLTIIFANVLSQHDFGTYKYVLATAGIIGAISLNALPGAQLRAIGKGLSEVIPRTVYLGMLWSLPGSLVALSIAAYYFFMGNPLLGTALLVVALTHPIFAASGITKILFSATGDFKTAMQFNVVRTIVPAILLASTVLLTGKILLVILVYFVSNAVVNAISYHLSLKKLGILGKNPSSESIKDTMHYGKHLSFLGALQIIFGQLDTFLLWHFAGPVVVATYAIALGPAKEFRSMSEQISTLFFPKLSRKSEETAAHSARLRSRQLFFIYLGVASLYAIAAPYVFAILFPAYLAAVLPSQILAFALVFQHRSLIDLFLFTHGELGDRYRITIPSQLLRAVLLFSLIPPFGLWGAVVAVLFSEFGSALIVIWAYRRFKRKQNEQRDLSSSA
jgi:O-antigen/teichoic acid export membrane protein